MNKLNKELLEEDFTDKCTFVNCTFETGKIYKIGRIVFFQILITSNITHAWGQIISLPNELYPIGTIDEGAPIESGFWAYQGSVKGALEKDKKYDIIGSYLAKY